MFVAQAGPLRFGGGRTGLYAGDFRLSLNKGAQIREARSVLKRASHPSFSKSSNLEVRLQTFLFADSTS